MGKIHWLSNPYGTGVKDAVGPGALVDGLGGGSALKRYSFFEHILSSSWSRPSPTGVGGGRGGGIEPAGFAAGFRWSFFML